ncbi:MAG: hypothetical protein AB1847_14820 [bacterium]
MNAHRRPFPLFFNGFFLGITAVGSIGLYLTKFPGSVWISLFWVLWVLANYLFLIRIKVCRHCAFYGRKCPMGWGKVVPLLAGQGDPDGFSRLKWPMLYFFSFALLPQFLMVVSLIRTWDIILACIEALFALLGLSLCILARVLCCPRCSMKSVCLLSKLPPSAHNF